MKKIIALLFFVLAWVHISPAPTYNNYYTTNVNPSISASGSNVVINMVFTSNNVYNLRDFGAVCDLKVVTRCDMTAGSPLLTSANGTWTAADVGKSIVIYEAWSNNWGLSCVITQVLSGTLVRVSSNCINTITSKSCYYGTDDTRAVQKAMDMISTNGTGGTLLVPAPTAVAGPLLDTGTNSTHHNSQLYFPDIPANGASFPSFTFKGPIEQSSSPGNSADYDDISILGGALVSFLARGPTNNASSMIDCRNFNSAISSSSSCVVPALPNIPMNALRVNSIDMAWVAPRDANITICNLAGAEVAGTIQNSYFGCALPLAGVNNAGALTGTNGFGLKLPSTFAEPYQIVKNPVVRGVVNGIDVAALVTISGGTIQGCSNAITVLFGGAHVLTVQDVNITSCSYAFAGIGCAINVYGNITMENALTGWVGHRDMIGIGGIGFYGNMTYEASVGFAPNINNVQSYFLLYEMTIAEAGYRTPLNLRSILSFNYYAPAAAAGSYRENYFEADNTLMWRQKYDPSDNFAGFAWRYQSLGSTYNDELAIGTNGWVIARSNIVSATGVYHGNGSGLTNLQGQTLSPTNNFFGDSPGGNVNHRITLGTNGAEFITADGGASGYYFNYHITNAANLGAIPSFTGPGFSVRVGANVNGIGLTSSNVWLTAGGSAIISGGSGIKTEVSTDDGSAKFYLNTMGWNAVGMTNSGYPNLLTIANLNGADSVIGAVSAAAYLANGSTVTNISIINTKWQTNGILDVARPVLNYASYKLSTNNNWTISGFTSPDVSGTNVLWSDFWVTNTSGSVKTILFPAQCMVQGRGGSFATNSTTQSVTNMAKFHVEIFPGFVTNVDFISYK